MIMKLHHPEDCRQNLSTNTHQTPLSQQSSQIDEAASEIDETQTCEVDDAFVDVPTACVRFVENFVTEVRYRPRTLPEDKSLLHYQESDFKKFRAEYVALKREYYRRRQMTGSEPQNSLRPTKTMLSRFLSYVFSAEESLSFSARVSTQVESSSLKASELLYSWDLGLISASF